MADAGGRRGARAPARVCLKQAARRAPAACRGADDAGANHGWGPDHASGRPPPHGGDKLEAPPLPEELAEDTAAIDPIAVLAEKGEVVTFEGA